MIEYDEKLSSYLFNKTKRTLLTLFFGRPYESFYVNQLVELVGSGTGTVQRELKLMTEAGIVIRERMKNLVYYRANSESPIFNDLKSIVNKTSRRYVSNASRDVTSQRFKVPKKRLAEFCRKHHIKTLALFGSVLREDFCPDSDIDVLVEFEPDHVPGFGIVDMQNELSLLVGRKVDLRTPGDLSRYFRDRIIREARVEYANDTL